MTELAEETGLYLDVTGLACYRRKDVPAWSPSLPPPFAGTTRGTWSPSDARR